MARPWKSAAARSVDPAGLPRISRSWAPSASVSSRCRMRVPAGSSTSPVRWESGGGGAAQAANSREATQAASLPHAMGGTSDYLDSHGREGAAAQAYSNFMRAGAYGGG